MRSENAGFKVQYRMKDGGAFCYYPALSLLVDWWVALVVLLAWFFIKFDSSYKTRYTDGFRKNLLLYLPLFLIQVLILQISAVGSLGSLVSLELAKFDTS